MSKKPTAPAESTTTSPQARKRVALYQGADGVAIVFPASKDPGAVAFGNLKPDIEYVVTPDEARRLTSEARAAAHRFEFVSAADAQRATPPAAAPEATNPQE